MVACTAIFVSMFCHVSAHQRENDMFIEWFKECNVKEI